MNSILAGGLSPKLAGNSENILDLQIYKEKTKESLKNIWNLIVNKETMQTHFLVTSFLSFVT